MFNLTASDADTIDQALFHLHAGSSSRTELQRLGDLFARRAFLGQLAMILRRASSRTFSPHVRVTVQLHWIDKRPYLESTSTPQQWKGKVELGDAAVFCIDQIRTHPRSHAHAQVVSASGLILQAKRTTSFSRILPTVHVHNDQSSLNQYAFLSTWPQVDLHQSTGKNSLILAGLTFTGVATTSRLGWYAVTPDAAPSTITNTMGRYAYGVPSKANWRSPWVGAPPVKGSSCAATLGEMLVAFFAATPGSNGPVYPGPLGAGIGHEFQFLRGWTAAKALGDGWDDLCNALLRMRNDKIGKHGGSAASDDKMQRILAYCDDPYEMAGYVGGVSALQNGRTRSQAAERRDSLAEDGEANERFPILIVRRTSFRDVDDVIKSRTEFSRWN